MGRCVRSKQTRNLTRYDDSLYIQERKIIKNEKRCRNGVPKSTQTRKDKSDGKYTKLHPSLHFFTRVNMVTCPSMFSQGGRVEISLPDSTSVLIQSLGQFPSSLANIRTVTGCTWDLVNYIPSLQVRHWVFRVRQHLSEGLEWFVAHSDAQGG